MPRPKIHRNITHTPGVLYFKPQGVPLRMLEEVVLLRDELEALKLHDVEGLDQTESAQRMGVSQPTFGRVLDSAYKKIADAIVHGKAIRIA